MITRLFLIISILGFVSPAYGDYFDGFKCNQTLPTSKEMQLEYIDRTLSLKWYKIDNATATFGDIESNVVNYLFWDDKFYGKVCAIIGKDNINEILRYFKKEVERIYADKPEGAVFKEPTKGKDGSYVYIEPDRIIIVRRFSVHLGQVEILCRELFEKRTGMIEEEVK